MAIIFDVAHNFADAGSDRLITSKALLKCALSRFDDISYDISKATATEAGLPIK